MNLDVKIFLDKVIDELNEPIALEIENILAEMSTYEMVTVFDRKQVKEEAEKIPLTIGQMQDMFNDYSIRVFNVETNNLEIATMHTATTADLLSVIKYYEDNLVKLVKDLISLMVSEQDKKVLGFDELEKDFKERFTDLLCTAIPRSSLPIIITDLMFGWVFDNIITIKHLRNNIAGIVWEKRYSTTEADDMFGRWMRIGRINGMTVAIITKAVHLEKIKYVLRLPNNKGDESLQSDIIANSENEAMLEAEKFIAGYVANFKKMEVTGK